MLNVKDTIKMEHPVYDMMFSFQCLLLNLLIVIIYRLADIYKVVSKKLGSCLKENLWQYHISPDTITMMTKKIRSFYFEKKEAPTVDEIANVKTCLYH